MTVAQQNQRGFVLITSLVFLVVITLLAVSAISSSTLQERMASNIRDKSRARQAADAALRHAELLLYNQGKTCFPKTSAHSCAGGLLYINALDGMFASTPADETAAFLDASVWTNSTVLTYNADTALPAVKFFVEYVPDISCQPTSNPGAVPTCFLYRITARAQGQNPAAIAVTQSVYKKSY